MSDLDRKSSMVVKSNTCREASRDVTASADGFDSWKLAAVGVGTNSAARRGSGAEPRPR